MPSSRPLNARHTRDGGAPPALLRKWQAKLGYTGDGACVYAVYANTPAFLPVDRDDVAIEIERP